MADLLPISGKMALGVHIKEEPLKDLDENYHFSTTETPFALPPWQNIVERVLYNRIQDNNTLMVALMEEMAFLLEQFASFVGKIRQECAPNSDKFPVEHYPRVHAALTVENPHPNFNLNGVNLLHLLKVEVKVKHDEGNGEHLQDPPHYAEEDGGDPMDIDQEHDSNKSRKVKLPPNLSLAQIAREAISSSESKMLTFEQIKAAIMAKHSCFPPLPPPKVPSLITGWHLSLSRILKKCPGFVQVEHERVKCAGDWVQKGRWTLTEDAEDDSATGDGDPFSWKPFFPVDAETWDQMRKKGRTKQCPRCEKVFYHSDHRSIVAHWKNNLCEDSLSQQQSYLMTREITGLGPEDKKRHKFVCTHQDCSESSKVWTTRGAVLIHYNSNHQAKYEGKVWKCPQCTETFIVKSILNKHVRDAHIEDFSCVFCGRVLKNRRNKRDHEMRHHRQLASLSGAIKVKTNPDGDGANGAGNLNPFSYVNSDHKDHQSDDAYPEEGIPGIVVPGGIPSLKQEKMENEVDPFSVLDMMETNPYGEIDIKQGQVPDFNLQELPIKPNLSMAQIACEAIASSESKKLSFEHLKAAISAKYSCFPPLPAPKTPSLLTGWYLTLSRVLKRYPTFIQVDHEGVNVAGDWVEKGCWTLSEETDSKSVPFDVNNKVQALDFSWKPFFAVDAATWEVMRKGRTKQCPKCDTVFTDQRSIVAHWKNKKCDQCQSLKQCNLMAKEVTGLGPESKKFRRYVCTHEDCAESPKQWVTRNAVLFHYNSNHKRSFKGKLWECPQCPESFIAEFILRKHVKEVHIEGNEKCWPCQYCGKVLESRKQRVTHERISCMVNKDAVQKFKETVTCEFCGIEVRKMRYFEHKRRQCVGISHDNEKKFSCEVCGKEFATKGKVVEHMSTHNDRPDPKFQCPICFKFMKQHNSFRKHMVNVHKQGHTCDICNKTFFDEEFLKRHKLNVHER